MEKGRNIMSKKNNHMTIPLLTPEQAKELIKALEEQQKQEGK